MCFMTSSSLAISTYAAKSSSRNQRKIRRSLSSLTSFISISRKVPHDHRDGQPDTEHVYEYIWNQHRPRVSPRWNLRMDRRVPHHDSVHHQIDDQAVYQSADHSVLVHERHKS